MGMEKHRFSKCLIFAKNLFALFHELLDEAFVMDLTVGVLSSLENDLDLLDGEFFSQSGKNVTNLSAHNGSVSFLVKDTETLNEVFIGSLLLFLSGLFDITEELIEVASGSVHLLLFGVSKDLSDILVGGLEPRPRMRSPTWLKKSL